MVSVEIVGQIWNALLASAKPEPCNHNRAEKNPANVIKHRALGGLEGEKKKLHRLWKRQKTAFWNEEKNPPRFSFSLKDASEQEGSTFSGHFWGQQAHLLLCLEVDVFLSIEKYRWLTLLTQYYLSENKT